MRLTRQRDRMRERLIADREAERRINSELKVSKNNWSKCNLT